MGDASEVSAATGSSWERIAIFVFGVAFVIGLLALAIQFPRPTPFQYAVFRVVLALAAAGIAALIPGFIEVRHREWLRAGGALAVFAIVYFFSPAQLLTASPEQQGHPPNEQPAVSNATRPRLPRQHRFPS